MSHYPETGMCLENTDVIPLVRSSTALAGGPITTCRALQNPHTNSSQLLHLSRRVVKIATACVDLATKKLRAFFAPSAHAGGLGIQFHTRTVFFF